jgi:hypothetical protein
MRIEKSVKQQSCVDGSLMRILLLDGPVTRDFLAYLETFGSLVLLEDSDSSFFTFRREGVLSVMGFVGDASVEIKTPKEFPSGCGDVFTLLCQYYHDGDPDRESVRLLEQAIQSKPGENPDRE